MAARSTTRPAINTRAQKGRRHTQRERLTAGMVAAANRGGYAGASVSAVIAEAGVSRPTFYEYFSDRDECFLAALADAQEQLAASVDEAVSSQAAAEALQAALSAVLGFAISEPARARFLMSEAMAAGTGALDVRDQGIARLARSVEKAYAREAVEEAVADVPAAIVIGGVYRLLATRLRRGERALSSLGEELRGWIDAYREPLGEHRWRASVKGAVRAPAPPSPPPTASALRAPPPLPPGRPRLSAEQIAANHRGRILAAAGQLAERQGYAETTIADITRVARIDGRAFYSQFADKQDAFMAVHELGFQELMAVTAGAFFGGASWPERTWEAGRALTAFLEQNPTLTHVGFIEAYAVGPRAVQRVEDSHTAFTIFLQEGYQYAGGDGGPSRVALGAVIASVFEIIYRQARMSGKPKVRGTLPLMVYLWLAPFVGVGEANAFVEAKVGEYAVGRG
jgi:AcrR family transcriptional regulator